MTHFNQSNAAFLLLGFMTNIDAFLAAVEEDAAFKPFGEKLTQYNQGGEVYEVYKVRTLLNQTFVCSHTVSSKL